MNIMLEANKPIVAGSDGAFIGAVVNTKYSRVDGALRYDATVTTGTRNFAGAEQRPLGVVNYPRPRAYRSPWLPIAAAIAIGYMLGHGNWGGAAITSVWLLGWMVQR